MGKVIEVKKIVGNGGIEVYSNMDRLRYCKFFFEGKLEGVIELGKKKREWQKINYKMLWELGLKI